MTFYTSNCSKFNFIWTSRNNISLSANPFPFFVSLGPRSHTHTQRSQSIFIFCLREHRRWHLRRCAPLSRHRPRGGLRAATLEEASAAAATLQEDSAAAATLEEASAAAIITRQATGSRLGWVAFDADFKDKKAARVWWGARVRNPRQSIQDNPKTTRIGIVSIVGNFHFHCFCSSMSRNIMSPQVKVRAV